LASNSPTALQSVCILRLSALGDVAHVLPVVHTLQKQWPQLKITWITGKLEHKLIGQLPGVEFIAYDKKGGWKAWRALRKTLAGRRFDALLLMQLSARANLVSTAVRARRRIGFDKARSKEGHSLFINERIAPRRSEHVLDGFLQFTAALGVEQPQYDWSLPTSEPDRQWAESAVPGASPFAIISPCSSHALRNWSIPGYAALADHLAIQHGLRIVLTGGPSAQEREMASALAAQMRSPSINLAGQDTLTQFIALLRRARVLVSPDSGPIHFAAITQTPALGLYAATDPQRSGPYHYRDFCVNAYSAAAQQYRKQDAKDLAWGRKIEHDGVMDLIRIEDAIAHADRLMAATTPKP
jgi:heptosyltransferase I